MSSPQKSSDRSVSALLDAASGVRAWARADATGARVIASAANLLSRLELLAGECGGTRALSPWLYGGRESGASLQPPPRALGALAAFDGLGPRLAIAHADEVARALALLSGGVLDALREARARVVSAAAAARAAAMPRATPLTSPGAAASPGVLDGDAATAAALADALRAVIASRTLARTAAVLQLVSAVDAPALVGAGAGGETGEGAGGGGGGGVDDDQGGGRARAAAASAAADAARAWESDSLETEAVKGSTRMAALCDGVWRMTGTHLFEGDA